MYFIAEDGTQFEDEWECVDYEEKLHTKQAFEPFSCYDKNGHLLDTDDENFHPDYVDYILIKKDNYENGDYVELDSFIFDGNLPALGNTFKDTDTTVIYYDHRLEAWHNWYEEFDKLTEMMKMFQLFAGKGE